MSDHRALSFALFNEIGIIAQLGRALFESRLPDGLNQPQFGVLNHLVRVGDGRTPLSIARAFQVPKTSMTHSLAVLEAQGLVELRPNPRDGRSRCVWLTPKGRAWRDQAIANLDPDFARIGARFTPEDIARVMPFLTELRQYLDAARDGGPEPDGPGNA